MKRILKSFKHAFEGIIYLIRTEKNAQLHILSLILIVIVGLVLCFDKTEWCIILLCIGGILSLEAINTAIERLTDLVTDEYHELAKRAKDVSAGAVLIMAIISTMIAIVLIVSKIK